MTNPSPRTHLYRLGIVLIVGFVGFVGIVALAAPASWNYEIANWYRTDALEELKAQPMVYGGIEEISSSKRNEACQSCHKEVIASPVTGPCSITCGRAKKSATP
jgi:hypothetical protein